MAYKTLIDTAELAAHLGDPSFAIVDCRFRLGDAAWGRQAFLAGHIPGAIYADLEADLSGPVSGTNGRHPLPDPERLANLFGTFGIRSGLQVVAYDQDNGVFASRLWWLLRWMGHHEVAVLDGGFAAWMNEGRAVAHGAETRSAAHAVRAERAGGFTGKPQASATADVADVNAHLADPAWRLVDARAPERYRGEVEPIDRVPGHIPGASNYFFEQNIGEDGRFLSPEDLRAKWLVQLGEVPAERTICYCGSGVTACHNLLALEHAGLPGARLYPGSWSEWSSDTARPVEKGGSVPP